MGEDSKEGKEHLREGKEHLEKGTQKMIQEGLQRHSNKLEYYRQNRSEAVSNVSRWLGQNKGPAISGLIVILPIAVVLWVIDWLFGKIESIPGSQLFNITDFYFLNQTVKLLILIFVASVIITGVGRFVRTKNGFKAEKFVDRVFDRIPIISSIYNITKVTTETILGGAEDFSQPVRITHGGVRLTGFKTGNKTEDGRDIVFMPTAPNITSGLVLELESDKIENSDETAEEALTRILSAGFGQSNKNKEESEEEEDEEN